MKKVLWAVVIIVVAALLIKGGQNKDKVAEITGPVKVGVFMPLTGDAAVYGEPARNIVQLAQEEINAKGGINGFPIELVIEDSKCTGAQAANAVQKLVNVDGVKVIIAGVCSSESLAAVPISEQAKVALLSPGASSPDLTGKSKFYSRDYPSDASQGKVLAEIAVNDKNWKKVTVIQEQTDYAVALFKAFKTTFDGAGGVAVSEEFPTQTTDFRSILTKVRESEPDAIFIDVQTPAAADRILVQIAQLGWKPSIILNDILSEPDFLAKHGAVIEGALIAQFGVNEENPKYKNLVESYKSKYGVDLPFPSYAQTEYDALYLVKDAIASVGYDGEKIAAWLQSVKDWDGASGKVTIGADGDRVGGHLPFVVVKSTLQPYQK